MYFIILGKNKEISLKELELINPTNIKNPIGGIITFETSKEDKIQNLAGITKRGKVIQQDTLNLLAKTSRENKKIMGINNRELGIILKDTFNVKRFKITKLDHTDLEIKKKGIEIIYMPYNKNSQLIQEDGSLILDGFIGQVMGYQNIKLYEIIDFDKPDRDMKIGMMPAKLTNILINIGLSEFQKRNPDTKPTIYDPFVGVGTTGLMANALEYDFIGSDMNISHMQTNFTRWRESNNFNKDNLFKIFEHNVINPLPIKQLENKSANIKSILIISEGRLGPIIHQHSTKNQITDSQTQVLKLYMKFLKNISTKFNQIKPIIVITIPHYINNNNYLAAQISGFCESIGFEIEIINEIYQRPNQKIGRQILIFK